MRLLLVAVLVLLARCASASFSAAAPEQKRTYSTDKTLYARRPGAECALQSFTVYIEDVTLIGETCPTTRRDKAVVRQLLAADIAYAVETYASNKVKQTYAGVEEHHVQVVCEGDDLTFIVHFPIRSPLAVDSTFEIADHFRASVLGNLEDAVSHNKFNYSHVTASGPISGGMNDTCAEVWPNECAPAKVSTKKAYVVVEYLDVPTDVPVREFVEGIVRVLRARGETCIAFGDVTLGVEASTNYTRHRADNDLPANRSYYANIATRRLSDGTVQHMQNLDLTVYLDNGVYVAPASVTSSDYERGERDHAVGTDHISTAGISVISAFVGSIVLVMGISAWRNKQRQGS